MAREDYREDPTEIIDEKQEKKRIAEEKKKLKSEQKAQKKEAKARAKDIEKQEQKLYDETGSGGNGSVFFVTLVIVLLWLAILALLVKLDVGGFGSGVLTPVLKDVPILNKILPSGSELAVDDGEEEAYGGYNNLREAVDYIRELELSLEQAQSAETGSSEEVAALQAEVARLKEFEDMQVEFQRIKNEFYEEVVYAENGPGPEAFQDYYEAFDPTGAEFIYRQVVQQTEQSQEILDWAQAYSVMDASAAAAIFEAMTDDLDRAARILETMPAENRGEILGAMTPEVAVQLTKIMDPES
jgi:flagellar motility protein MotE (MotC chaperone)